LDDTSIKKIFITADHQLDKSDEIENGNTDVIVILEDGHKYTASFFTYAYIDHMRIRNRMSGEFLGGKYFWGKNMVVVESCSPEVISPVVKHIIDEGEFNDVFRML
jgi:hypothetical protein